MRDAGAKFQPGTLVRINKRAHLAKDHPYDNSLSYVWLQDTAKPNQVALVVAIRAPWTLIIAPAGMGWVYHNDVEAVQPDRRLG